MAKIYFADGMDCELALQDGASVGDALATAAARLDVKKPHARFLALHAASATGAVDTQTFGRSRPVWKSKVYGAFVLNRRVVRRAAAAASASPTLAPSCNAIRQSTPSAK